MAGALNGRYGLNRPVGDVPKGSSPLLTTVLVSISVVFLAELGDKSQLMTMAYALRHRWWVVLSGVGIAAFLVHGLSVMIGHFLGLTLPERPIAFAAAITFLLFAVWTWRAGRAGDTDQEVKVAEPRHVLLATVTLASNHSWAGVWIGATAGMVLADGGRHPGGRGAAQAAARALPARAGKCACPCSSGCGCSSTEPLGFGG
jgi:putative Ca2+/H+ antiporter (TMEM165/GDT1 family)